MAKVTKVWAQENQRGYASLRTTVPRSVCRAAGLRHGSRIEWSSTADGSIVARRVAE